MTGGKNAERAAKHFGAWKGASPVHEFHKVQATQPAAEPKVIPGLTRQCSSRGIGQSAKARNQAMFVEEGGFFTHAHDAETACSAAIRADVP